METIEKIKKIIDEKGYWEYKNDWRISYKEKRIWDKSGKDYKWVSVKTMFEVRGHCILPETYFRTIEKCIEHILFYEKYPDPQFKNRKYYFFGKEI